MGERFPQQFRGRIYMATLSTVLVFAVLGVVWRAGRRLALRATHRIPRDAQPLLEDTKFVICLALVGGFGLLLTLNPGLLVLPKDTTFTEQVARQAGLERCLARPSTTPNTCPERTGTNASTWMREERRTT